MRARSLFFSILCIGATYICSSCASSRPVNEQKLFIKAGRHKVVWSRRELLRSPNLERVEVSSDPTYGVAVRKFRAIRAAILFQKALGEKRLAQMMKDGSTLEFSCLDGFSASLPIRLLLNSDNTKAIAYIAIEPRGEKWPALKMSTKKATSQSPRSFTTAGPFYLIWKNAARSHVGPEQWPYQLSGFTVKPPIARQFPQMVPSTRNKNVIAGFHLFLKNCFTCHTMNNEGDSHLGPDLNIPMSPIEYLRAGMIRRLIRNPQNLRRWPESKMSSFSPDVLSDRDIDHIIDYLKFMSRRKRSAHTQKNIGAIHQ